MEILASDLPSGPLSLNPAHRTNRSIPVLCRRIGRIDAIINTPIDRKGQTEERIENAIKTRAYLVSSLKFQLNRDFPDPLRIIDTPDPLYSGE
jgi:hypothetical protein